MADRVDGELWVTDENQLERNGLLLPSSGEEHYKNNSTYLFFRFRGGRGQLIVFLGLKDLFHKATYSERNNERKSERSASLT